MAPSKFAPLGLGLVLALGACSTSLDTYYRTGGKVAQLETDMLGCEVAALKDAPVANEVRQRPPVYVPAPYYCTSGRYCYGGYWADGGIYTVDVNKDLRIRITDQCMSEKGYKQVSIPRCSQSVSSQLPDRQTTVMPPLTPNSCVSRNADGTYQLVETQG
ncbi:MAG: hypothetical protein OIF47_07325 [Marinibacterium sp.]|nr:hypothetical protein [Marinibacterium sp.]